jgi:Uncharacterized protein conserved in bacteria (DUF2188)
MADGFVHTVHSNGRWVTTIEGEGKRPGSSYTSKEMATAAGRAEARRRKTEHVIHNEDGSIAERDSYGNDRPARPG